MDVTCRTEWCIVAENVFLQCLVPVPIPSNFFFDFFNNILDVSEQTDSSGKVAKSGSFVSDWLLLGGKRTTQNGKLPWIHQRNLKHNCNNTLWLLPWIRGTAEKLLWVIKTPSQALTNMRRDTVLKIRHLVSTYVSVINWKPEDEFILHVVILWSLLPAFLL